MVDAVRDADVMWDNRVLLHRAIEYDYARYRRVLRRTTVGGSTHIIWRGR